MRRSLLLIAMLAYAPHASAGNEISAEEADKRFQEGVDLFKHRKYQESYVKFVEACAAHRTPDCPKNLAMAEMRLNRHADAATHFREYLRSPKFTSDPASSDLRAFYDGELATVGLVRIAARDGASVKIDGEIVGIAPLSDAIFTEPGKHHVTATYGDHAEERDTNVVVHQTVDVDARRPEPVAAESPRPPDTVTSFWSPGRFVGVSMMAPGAAAGGYVIGFAMAAGDASTRASQLRQQIGDVGACSGSSDPRCADLARATNAQHSNENAAIGFGIASGALVVGGAAMMLFSPGKTRRVGVRVRPTLGGIMIDGTF